MAIALIHALRHSPPPIEAAFARHWPDAVLRSVLDESLSADRAREGMLTPAMTARFLALGRRAANDGAQAILFTCSAFGPCIDAVREALHPLPVRGPAEAMIARAAASGQRIGLLASFAPTLASMPAEFPVGVEVVPIFAAGALDALAAGDGETHDRLAAEAAARAGECDLIALAQYSLARSAAAVERATGLEVVTAPDAAVLDLRRALKR